MNSTFRRVACLIFVASPGACGGQVIVDADSSTTSSTASTASTASTGGGPGAPCSSAEECATGFCVDGVCCAAACDGVCVACASEKTGAPDGECAPIPAGEDPDDECLLGTACDGEGACDPDCNGKTCEDLGFSCGECVDTISGCGHLDIPWAGWDTAFEPEEGDTIVEVSLVEGGVSCRSDNAGGDKKTFLTLGNTSDPDNPSWLVWVGGLVFDLSALPPDAKIVSATAELWQGPGEGNAFQPPMSQVVVEHVRFVTPHQLCDAAANAATIGERVLSTDPEAGWRIVDLVEAARHDLATCRDVLQARIRFAPEIGMKTEPKSWTTYNTNPKSTALGPKLTIRHR